MSFRRPSDSADAEVIDYLRSKPLNLKEDYSETITTEVVADIQMASRILNWYSYRWRVEEYHKIFKSGCQVERYRLAADGMKTLIGFLSVIAVELLQLTYLHRTQPNADAIVILNPLQLRILKAKSPKLPKILTVSWALGCDRSFRRLLRTST
ncbi:hypothetical protein [Nostoc sphaeroides]|uniref:Putative transposase n=1 Tax=Nostoc sphaeroides CCNUC1 TaxID=2653204 RepID=A0A5P8WF65_9NOSO|nr:putative transposase [Nostoc sphaeroides CCNUC1]